MIQHQNRLQPSLPPQLMLRQEVRMEVVFGTPSQNCIGSGVCMVMSRLPRTRVLPCPHAPARVSYQSERLVFRFSKSEVTRKDALKHFGSSFFLVNEPFSLPVLAKRHLGLPGVWVQAGLYPIEQTAQDWIIGFKLMH